MNKILTAVVVVALIAAIGVLIYAYMPRGGNEDNTNIDTSASFTLIHGNQSMNVTIAKIMAQPQYHGAGGYRTNTQVMKGVGNYTGITFKNLASYIQVNTPFAVNVTTSDMSRIYSREEIAGNVSLYDLWNPKSNYSIGIGGVDMVLAYEFNNTALAGSDGHFKVAFLGPDWKNPPVTDGALWLRDVRSIQILT
jgi:hypothetical protein